MDTRCVAHVVFCCPPPASWQTPADTTKLRHTSTAVRGRHIKQIFMAHRGSKINRELNQTLLKSGEEEAEEKIGEPLQSLGFSSQLSPGVLFFQENCSDFWTTGTSEPRKPHLGFKQILERINLKEHNLVCHFLNESQTFVNFRRRGSSLSLTLKMGAWWSDTSCPHTFLSKNPNLKHKTLFY